MFVLAPNLDFEKVATSVLDSVHADYSVVSRSFDNELSVISEFLGGALTKLARGPNVEDLMNTLRARRAVRTGETFVPVPPRAPTPKSDWIREMEELDARLPENAANEARSIKDVLPNARGRFLRQGSAVTGPTLAPPTTRYSDAQTQAMPPRGVVRYEPTSEFTATSMRVSPQAAAPVGRTQVSAGVGEIPVNRTQPGTRQPTQAVTQTGPTQGVNPAAQAVTQAIPQRVNPAAQKDIRTMLPQTPPGVVGEVSPAVVQAAQQKATAVPEELLQGSGPALPDWALNNTRAAAPPTPAAAAGGGATPPPTPAVAAPPETGDPLFNETQKKRKVVLKRGRGRSKVQEAVQEGAQQEPGMFEGMSNWYSSLSPEEQNKVLAGASAAGVGALGFGAGYLLG